MPNITDVLEGVQVGGTVKILTSLWVRLVNNATSAAFVSTAASDPASGNFTVSNVPSGTYTVYTGPSNTGPWTATGTSAYNVPDELALINVMDYGAKGDGVTDDTNAIQAALNAANTAGGGVVYLPAPAVSYWVTLSLTVYSNTTVRGAGWATFLQMGGAWTSTKGLFTAAIAASRVVIEDLRIDCLKASKAAATTSRGVYIQQATEVRIRRLHITDAGHAGILVDGGSDAIITENYIVGGGDGTNGVKANGISVDIGGAALSNVVISNNVCKTIPDSGIGVHDNTKNVTVSGNVIEGAGAVGGGHGIDLAGCQQASCTGNVVNCGTTSDGIYVHQNLATYNALDISITGNTIIGPGAAGNNGISISGTNANPADRLSIVGNTIRGMANAGIAITTECQFSVVSGNVVHANAGDGILMDNGGTGNLQYVNVVGNVVTSNGGYGIHFHPAVANCKIHSNLLYNNTSGGTSAAAAQAISNYFIGNGPQETTAYMGPAIMAKDLQRSRQAPAFNATPTPDPTLGEIYQMAALTGNVTVTNPVAPVTGQKLTFIWTQNGVGGKTVTYGTAFKTGGAVAVVTTASTVTIDDFIYDGTNWRLLSRITGQ